VTEIVRVEQVLDIRTVPVKRIDALVFGHPWALDSRHADRELLKPLSWPEEKKDEKKDDASGPPSKGGSSLGPPPGMPGGMGPMGPPGVPGVPGGARRAPSGQASGGGAVTSVIDGNRHRYLEVTNQVRRMPVGIVLVVDQAYMEDVLMAF